MDEFVVPKKGLTIPINEFTFNVYKSTIVEKEGMNIKRQGDYFFLNGQPVTHYTFRKDYIFVMGDNRKNSLDSRHFGFIPYEDVVGRVQLIF